MRCMIIDVSAPHSSCAKSSTKACRWPATKAMQAIHCSLFTAQHNGDCLPIRIILILNGDSLL